MTSKEFRIIYSMVLNVETQARDMVKRFGENEITLEEGKQMLAVLRTVIDTGLKTVYTVENEDFKPLFHRALDSIDYHEKILRKIHYQKMDALQKIMYTIEY